MDFFDLVKKRRSVRKFSNENVPDEVILKALKTALLAANSSNLQPWEFYWVKDDNKKEDLIKACFSQNAAKTAQELIVAVSRIDTWKRNRNLILKNYKEKGKLIPIVEKYYNKVIPLSYTHDRIGLLGVLKKILSFFIGIVGLFKKDMSGLYLCIAQGTTQPLKDYGKKGGEEFLLEQAEKVRDIVK